MKSLRWEIDSLESCDCFARRQFLLTSSDRALQRGRERAVDPYRQIEMVAMVHLERIGRGARQKSGIGHGVSGEREEMP